MTFTYTFEYDDDCVFFAYCYPYTYTDLCRDLQTIERDPKRRVFMQRHPLCKTLAGVNCEVLTITDQKDQDTLPPSRKPPRKGVVLSARVHPGETVGSWMMRGALFFLTDPDSEEAALLRQNFVFKVIPMLNPDGVINGNYRCSLAGCDLNRRWKFPSRQLQPTIYHAKKLIKKVHTERDCILYCDFHGHSRKPNIFMYGCNNRSVPEECRVFPLLLSKISPLFDFSSSRFGVQKSKEATARVAVYKELKTCPQIYTIESTFSGMDKGLYAGQHINTEMLESMGRDLCRAILVRQNLYVPKELEQMAIDQKSLKNFKTFSAEPNDKPPNQQAFSINQSLWAELSANKALLQTGEGDSSSGSDSEPSEDNLDAKELVKNLPAIDKPLSQALKQEKQQKHEPPRQRKISPQKQEGEQKARWRFSATAKSFNVQEDPSPVPQKRNNRAPSKALPEIKEEIRDGDSPPTHKLDKTAAKDSPNKKPKPAMVDAVTQTERSDYYTLKMRALKRQLKHQTSQSPTKRGNDNLVRLRIANIQLQDNSAAGPKSGSVQPQTSVQLGPQTSEFQAVITSPNMTRSQPQSESKKKQQLNCTGYTFTNPQQAAYPFMAYPDNRQSLQRQVQNMVVGQRQGSSSKITAAQMGYTSKLVNQTGGLQHQLAQNRSKVINRAVNDKLKIINALKTTGFQQGSDPLQGRQANTETSQDAVSARYVTAINKLQVDKLSAENELSASMVQKRSTPIYVLPNKNARTKTRDSPYQLQNLTTVQQPGDQSSDYVDGDRDFSLAGIIKMNNRRTAISQQNQSFDSKSAVIDRSLSLGQSSQQTKQEQMIDQPLPQISYQLGNEKTKGNNVSAQKQETLSSISNSGFKKLLNSQQNGMLHEEHEDPQSDAREKADQKKKTKTFADTLVLRHQSTTVVTMGDLSLQKGDQQQIGKQSSQRLISLRPTELDKEEPRTKEPKQSITEVPTQRVIKIGDDMRMSDGSQVRVLGDGDQEPDEIAQKNQDNNQTNQRHLSSQYGAFYPPAPLSKTKQMPAGMRKQVQQQNLTRLYSKMLGQAAQQTQGSKNKSPYQSEMAQAGVVAQQCNINTSQTQKVAQITAMSKFRAPPPAVRNIHAFSQQSKGGIPITLQYGDRDIFEAPQQLRARSQISQQPSFASEPLQVVTQAVNGSNELPSLQQRAIQGHGARKLVASSQNTQGQHVSSRSPTVTLREEQKVKDFANQLMLKNQPHSSTQVYGATAANKPPRERSAEFVDFSRSQRLNQTTLQTGSNDNTAQSQNSKLYQQLDRQAYQQAPHTKVNVLNSTGRVHANGYSSQAYQMQSQVSGGILLRSPPTGQALRQGNHILQSRKLVQSQQPTASTMMGYHPNQQVRESSNQTPTRPAKKVVTKQGMNVKTYKHGEF